jgi:hypothetical protein
MGIKPAILAAGLLVASPSVWPHDYSLDECLEGSDFIRNAALSRDNGLSRAEFIDRMYADIALIQAFPKELRWFVQDEDDAALLLGHAAEVFDEPRAPESHQTTFLRVCVGKIAAASGLGVEPGESPSATPAVLQDPASR